MVWDSFNGMVGMVVLVVVDDGFGSLEGVEGWAFWLAGTFTSWKIDNVVAGDDVMRR